MILAGLLAVAIFPGRFVEESVPTAQATLIEAAVVFPCLTPDDRAIEEVIASSLLEGTADYTKSQMKAATSFLGEPLRCSATPDCLRITIGVRKDDWKTGLRILKSLLTNPDLSKDSVEAAKANLPFLNRSPWKSAFDPVLLPYDHVRQQDVSEFWHRNIGPEVVSIVISGPYTPGAPRDFWMEESADWPASNRHRFPADRRKEIITRRPDLSVSILRWNGPELAPSDAKLAAPLLAAYALGVGKDSAAFRILREKERLSYRQEVVLSPSGNGFRLQLMTAFLPRENEAALPLMIREDMEADIDQWTEATRIRALELARASMLRHALSVPLCVTSEGALLPADSLFVEAYWPMKTNEPWNTRRMLGAMEGVSLPELKAISKDLFDKGSVAQSQ